MHPRRPTRPAAIVVATAAMSVVTLAGAVRGAEGTGPSVDVVKVQGVIDPSLVSFVTATLQQAERDGSSVILQIDSRGSYGEEGRRLGEVIRSTRAPVIAWVGPTGARAEGGALFPVYASSLAAMAPGSGLGPATPFDLGTSAPRESAPEVARNATALEALAPGAGATVEGVRSLITGPSLPAGPALDRGAVALVASDLADLLTKLDGRVVRTRAGGVALATENQRDRPVPLRFHDMGPVRRVLHAVSTPTAVYFLLVLGLWGIAFELTQPGLGVAGLAGLLALALGGYGLAVIPVHWAGIAMLVAGVGLQGLDVLVKRLAWLTGAGTALFAAGSLLAWWGVAPAIDLSLWLVVAAAIAGFLFFGFALTVALRSRERVRSAQVGLVGLVGETRSDLDPEGGVYVKGTLWRARSSDGPIPKGSRVRIRGVDGLILRVEPEPDQPAS